MLQGRGWELRAAAKGMAGLQSCLEGQGLDLAQREAGRGPREGRSSVSRAGLQCGEWQHTHQWKRCS